MARPRTVADDDVLAAANRVLQRSGPDGLTLASVGAEAGLAAATLVQRYGSKDALLQAALVKAWDLLDAATAEADAREGLDPAGAIMLLLSLTGQYGDHDTYAEGLLLLREDMRDPVLRIRGEQWGAKLEAALGRRLTKDATRQATLGRLMASVWQGSLIWWGFSREGDLAAYVGRQLREWCKATGVGA
jgi:AcrR family transcriptional regulator